MSRLAERWRSQAKIVGWLKRKCTIHDFYKNPVFGFEWVNETREPNTTMERACCMKVSYYINYVKFSAVLQCTKRLVLNVSLCLRLSTFTCSVTKWNHFVHSAARLIHRLLLRWLRSSLTSICARGFACPGDSLLRTKPIERSVYCKQRKLGSIMRFLGQGMWRGS